MTSDLPGYAHEYATAILRRGRDPMPPVDFAPNWGDAPRRGKFYPHAAAFPLPVAASAEASVDACLDGTAGDEPFTLAALADLLQESYGLLGRRLGITANTDLNALPLYAHANWYWGTASGGGLYPCSIYWIAGPGAGVAPGVYYYVHSRHSLQRLLAGDVTDRVRAALGDGVAAAGQYLLVGVKYWQNAFKYNNFSYHAVTMDVGTVLETWRMRAAAERRSIRPAYWFDQAALGELLGLNPEAEAVLAAVPLTWSDAPTDNDGVRAPVRVRHEDRERSRVLLTFDALQRMNRTTAAAASDRPSADALADAGALPAPEEGERIALPPAEPMTMPLSQALRRRRSSFGRFDATQRMTAEQLAALLASVHRPLAKVYAFVNHVGGVPAAGYEYDTAGKALCRVTDRAPGLFLQRNYFLANYNLEQAGVVVVPTIRTHAVLDAVGERGYNIVNATIGAIAQAFYTAASALDLGAGVALGFDNVSYIEELGVADTGEFPLLIMLAGYERAGLGDYRYELR